MIHLRPQVESLGFKGIAAYDELAERIARELERVAVAAAAAATLGGHLTELHDLVEALVPDRPASQDEARALLERVREDRNALAGLAGEVEQARQRYLAAVNELLRKPVDGFDVARLTLAEVAQELATLAGLETAADDYVAGAAARAPGLTTLAKIKTWLGREQRKAELLRDALAAADHDVQRAVRSLGRSAAEGSPRRLLVQPGVLARSEVAGFARCA